MDFTQGKVFVQIVLRTEEEGVSESEIGPKIFSKSIACLAGAKRGGGRGEGEREKGREPSPSPQSPPLFPFLPIPYPLPLSTPATQATKFANPLAYSPPSLWEV